jgi:transposase
MRSQLEDKLKCPEGFSTYGKIVEWLKEEFDLEVKYQTVYRLVRYQIDTSGILTRCQKMV